MKYSCLAAIISISILFLSGCPDLSLYPGKGQPNTLTQYGTIDALMIGQYDGLLTLDSLKRYGDFGLGTFNGLDGEMVVIDGSIYQVAYSGTVTEMPGDTMTPFAAVNFFVPDCAFTPDAGLDYAGLQAFIDARLPSRNLICAIRIDGVFPYMKTRSVPRQEAPYPPLAEVVEDQAEFEFEDISGSLVGYYAPYFVDNENVPGYHCHFISDDRQYGGHILDFETGETAGLIDKLYTFTVLLPDTEAFLETDFDEDSGDGLEDVENDKERIVL